MSPVPMIVMPSKRTTPRTSDWPRVHLARVPVALAVRSPASELRRPVISGHWTAGL